MLRASGFLLGSSLVLLAACERAADEAARRPTSPPACRRRSRASWHVEGVTVEKASGKTRQISGTIILAEEGGKYHSTFDLDDRCSRRRADRRTPT